MFEEGEHAHGGDRIVRIGSHSGHRGTLAQRLDEHFGKANKDRSIFRKHIGRALLARRGDTFLKFWDLDLTARKSRELNAKSVDATRLAEVEKEVTSFLQRNFSFSVLPIPDRLGRLEAERRLIATVALCAECTGSPTWLGCWHPNPKIRQSCLWNVQGLSGRQFNGDKIRALFA